MRYILILVLLFTKASFASVPISNVNLPPIKAFCAGFTLDRPTVEYVGLKFPKVINEKWFPVATMVEYRLNKNPIFITKTKFKNVDDQDHMIILGFHETMQNGSDAVISITYQCKGKCGVRYLKNYTIPSIVSYVNADVQLCL